jgi:pimeloyl-ACP methyl ester carboxylesterase
MREVILECDVTEAVGLGQELRTVATVCLPDELPTNPLVCFAWPGGGYSRRYFTFDMPGSAGGGQAGWHTARGWVFVACDHLHCGDSTRVDEPERITYEHLVEAAHATTQLILARLSAGGLDEELAPLDAAFGIGIGQSLGGATIVLQQGQRATFDAIGVLGWSAIGAAHWFPPDAPSSVRPTKFIPRGTNVGTLTSETFTAAMPGMAPDDSGLPATTGCYFFDDVPEDIIRADMIDYPTRGGELPIWGTDSIPPAGMTMMSPGAVAPEAASITSPVFIGVGERDVVPTPKDEPNAYQQASDLTVFVCPAMGHMHNFAGTRELFWARLHAWGDGLLAVRSSPVTESTVA